MRSLVAGLVFVAALTGAAAAERWTADDTRLVFEAPDGWSTARAATTSRTYVVARGEAGECHFMSVAREATAAETPFRLRLASREPLAETVWTSLPTALPRVFADARLVSRRVDSEDFWPIHFGRYEGNGRTVHAAAQFRPGMEYWGFCFAAAETTGAANPFESVLRSIGDSGDAELRASVEQEEARRQANMQADLARNTDQHRRRFEGLPDEFLGAQTIDTPGTPMGGGGMGN